MQLASVASSLARAQESAGALPSAKGAKGVLKGARGALGGLAKKVTGGKSSRPAIPADGTRCQDCGTSFGMFNRRTTCGTCERFLCAACCGQNQLAAVTGIRCFCDASCSRCRDQNSRCGEFQAVREAMEEGVCVTAGLPVKGAVASFFGAADGRRQVAAFLKLETEERRLAWASLEQRDGRPAEEGHVPLHEILYARDTMTFLEVALTSQKVPIIFTFPEASEREAWAEHVELAVRVLTHDEDRAALDDARAKHRRYIYIYIYMYNSI